MAVCDITIIPAGIDKSKIKNLTNKNIEKDFKRYNPVYLIVDEIIETIKKSGLKYKVGAMSTTVEGTSEQLFELVKVLHQKAFLLGAKDVITQFRIHESLIYDDTIEGKTFKHL